MNKIANHTHMLKVTDFDSFKKEIERQKDVQSLKIKFQDLKFSLLYSDIPLNMIYERCNVLNLKLDGFNTNQNDFNQFCSNLLKFKHLQSLSLRFYSKRIQNLDGLFKTVSNIENVELNLKDYKKIKFNDDFTQPTKIQRLSLNLVNVTFKTLQDEVKFENFIGCQQDLQIIYLKLKNSNQFKYMLRVPKTSKIHLTLTHNSVDLQQCDQLIEFTNKNKLENIVVDEISSILGLYLSDKGINVMNLIQIKNPQQYISLSSFKPLDFKLLKQVPQYINYILANKPDTFIQISGLKNQMENNFKYLIPQIDHIFRHLNCYFEGNIDKLKNSWQISIISELVRLIPYIVNITLKYNSGTSYESIIQMMKYLGKSEYIISCQLNDVTNYSIYQQYDQLYQQIQSFTRIIQEKSLTRLRFFVFKNYIFDLIPIPNQIFYDLIEK